MIYNFKLTLDSTVLSKYTNRIQKKPLLTSSYLIPKSSLNSEGWLDNSFQNKSSSKGVKQVQSKETSISFEKYLSSEQANPVQKFVAADINPVSSRGRTKGNPAQSFYTAYSKLSEIKLITIGLASPEKIRQWAEKTLPNGKIIGEVTNANTLHHKTFKPQKGGLFCERIFGPLKDFSCSCGKVQKPSKQEKAILLKNQTENVPTDTSQTSLLANQKPIGSLTERKYCPVCDVEYTWSVIRRYQLGYINLISPVTHLWYLKATPSSLSILLDMKKRHLEYVAYCTETLTLENTLRGNVGQQRRTSSELFSIWEKIMKKSLLKNKSNSSQESQNQMSKTKRKKFLAMKDRINIKPQKRKQWYIFSHLLNEDKTDAQKITVSDTFDKTKLNQISLLVKTLIIYQQKSLYRVLTDLPEFRSTQKNKLALSTSLFQSNLNLSEKILNQIKGTNYIKKLLKTLPLYFYIFFNLELTLQKIMIQNILVLGWKKFIYAALQNTFYKFFVIFGSTTQNMSFLDQNTFETVNKTRNLLLEKELNSLNDSFSNSFIKNKDIFKELLMHVFKTNYLNVVLKMNTKNNLIHLISQTNLTNDTIIKLYSEDIISTFMNLHSYKKLVLITEDLFFQKLLNEKQKFSRRTDKNDFFGSSNLEESFDPKIVAKKFLFYKETLLNILNFTYLSNPLFVSEQGNQHIELLMEKWLNQFQSISKNKFEFLPLTFVSSSQQINTQFFFNSLVVKNSYYNGELFYSSIVKLAEKRHRQRMNETSRLGSFENKYEKSSSKNKFQKSEKTNVLPKLVNNFYILSHRERWGADTSSLQNWNYLNQYLCFFGEPNAVGTENSVSNGEENSQFTLFRKNYKLISCYRYRFAMDLTSSTFDETQSTIEKSVHSKNMFSKKSENFKPMFVGQYRNAFFSGPGMIQQLLNEFDFTEMKKMDKQNRIFLYQLNRTISFLRKEIYLKSAKKELKEAIKKREQLIRRTKLLRKLFRKDSDPKSMILTILPVLPPDLRPIVKVGGQIAASDLNRLYQRVIYRNDRLKKFLKDPATSSSFEMKYAQRLLQEAVDNLIQNGKSSTNTEKDARGRALKSLSELLKGKQGRFRQYLLGKRVDYSGRSVIVVGPKLKLHECGLPKEMALELYLPFLLKRILNQNLARTVAGAKDLLKNNPTLTWELLKEIMHTCPVLLNRAPTLHRLGIQAFQPKLIEGRAILLHPLVCSAFNADFDGDQMAVHVPITVEARAEAWKLMLARNNFLSPATGDPLSIPSQDMVLGCYYLTTNCNKKSIKTITGYSQIENHKVVSLRSNEPNLIQMNTSFNSDVCDLFYFSNLSDVLTAYYRHKIELHSIVWVKYTGTVEYGNSGSAYDEPMEIRLNSNGNWQEIYKEKTKTYDKDNMLITQYIATTPGRILLNSIIQKCLQKKSNLLLDNLPYEDNFSTAFASKTSTQNQQFKNVSSVVTPSVNNESSAVLTGKDLDFLTIFKKQVNQKRK